MKPVKKLDFYFRQLWDGKGKLEVEEMGPERMAIFGGLCGKVLAFRHARSGDAMMLGGYIGKKETFDNIRSNCSRYADRSGSTINNSRWRSLTGDQSDSRKLNQWKPCNQRFRFADVWNGQQR